jgi:hypothetical protein
MPFGMRAPRAAALAFTVALVVTACDFNPVANESDEPIETGSTVFQLLQLQLNVDRALNVVFVPDTAYGDMTVLANRQAFLDDLGDVVDTGYWQNQVWVKNVGVTNFFYMTVAGTAADPTTGICPTVTWPAEADTDAAFADVLVLIHTNTLRDCRSGRKVTSEPGSFRTVVHESSHALFNLPDEYCCDGGYWVKKPVLYDTESDCTGDAANAAWRDCVSFTATGGEDWWRSEDTDDDIMSVGGSVVLEYGRADWVVVEAVITTIGTPNPPTVFAPDTWDRP